MADEPKKSHLLLDPRLPLAAERTLLAWVRTGLAMMGFGFIVARFGMFLREMAAARGIPSPAPYHLSLWIGAALIILGVVVNILSARQYVCHLHRFNRNEPYEPRVWSMAVIVTLMLAALGVVMTVYLFISAQ
jgi:putative membrane protein